MNSVADWHMLKLYLKILWNDPNEIPKTLTTSRIVNLLFSWQSTFTWSTFPSGLLADGRPSVQTSVLPTVCSPKATFDILIDSVAFFPQFRVKFDADMLFFLGCHFLGMPKSWMQQHTCVLNTTLLKGYINPWSQITQAIKFCLVTPNTCGPSVWNFV